MKAAFINSQTVGGDIAVAVLSEGEQWGLAIFHILTKLNYLSTLYASTSVLQWAGWAIVTYGRVDKRKKFFGASHRICQTNVCPPWPETLPAPLLTLCIYLLSLTKIWFTVCLMFINISSFSIELHSHIHDI